MNLYDISKAINEISEMVDDDWVLLPEAEEKLTNLEMTKTEKFKNLWGLIKNIDANINALKEEKKILWYKQKVLENKKERWLKWIKFVMESTPWNMPIEAWIFKFKLRAFSSVQIDDWEKIPEKYINTKIEQNPDKKLIAKDIKDWVEIPWASIVKNNSVIIS